MATSSPLTCGASSNHVSSTSPPAAFMPTKAWWKEAVIYQIYPISFFDSNGDGIGDLNGIHAKLDYLRDLGVDVIWLSPIYRSPLADMGYDISDYENIDPRYGTLADWDNLLKGVHERGMKLMMDLVVNHTSDEHDWFLRSRSSKSDPKRDWYIWRPPKYDSAGNRCTPNNWKSTFQGPAWDYDEKTGEYYLHIYVAKQPDLNWDNPDVREAAWDVMRFWINRGCDGFRMDVINLISKAEGLPDAPITVPGDEYQPASMHFANGPRVHEYIKEMHSKVLSKQDLITVGETPFTHDASQLAAYVLPANKELNMVFQFELMDIDSPKEGQDIAALKTKKWSVDEFRNISGTQFVYQGQELALKNFPRSWGIQEYKDVASLNYWNSVLAQRRAERGTEDVDMSDTLDNFQKKARDHSRVPMQWDDSPNAGFTTGVPWMRVNEDHGKWNAASQLADENSVLAFWKQALGIRKQYDVLVREALILFLSRSIDEYERAQIYGDFTDISHGHPSVFAYVRTLEDTKAMILLNFKEEETEFELPDAHRWDDYVLTLRNYQEEGTSFRTSQKVRLRGFESRLYIRA
ncbi:hypothetical protein CVT26_006972 [Gymnopilus dilepis]|uniref:Glycosyl hydrolase family 13 catalytic domain-containing protein n=1 Tax=Gymnopilus dilepis TaxID=231916 RepID=A0A409W154_9AGAR|nr:hypothetical protein CVT26_006972 [Gymnopilus dilepis]